MKLLQAFPSELKTDHHKSPRIGIVSANDDWGGSEILWSAMAEEALDAGHPLFIALRPWEPLPRQVQQLKDRGANILFYSDGQIREGIYRRFPWLSHRARRFLDQFQCLRGLELDALCVSLGWTYQFLHRPGLSEFLQATKVPYTVVVQYVDNQLLPANDHDRACAIRFFTEAQRVAFVAEQNLRDTERQLGVPLANAVVVRNPLVLSDISPVRWPEGKTLSLACVARLYVKAKGQDVLFEALSQPEWKERDWELNLYGTGEDGNYLKALVEHYGIQGRVQFHGHVDDIRQVWTKNHLCVMPSRGEGTPLALVEAMSCGRAAVVTDVGGNAEWIKDGENGFLAPAPTAHWVGQALERAWKRRSEWESLGHVARHTALRQYDPQPGRTLLEMILGRDASCVRHAA